MYEEFWDIVADDINKNYGNGHPSNWNYNQIRTFLDDMRVKLSDYYKDNAKIANNNNSSLKEITPISFKRIFILKKTKDGKVKTRNMFANYLGYQSAEDFINQNKNRFKKQYHQKEILEKSIVSPYSIIGLSNYINEKVLNFTGRKWILDAIEQFMTEIENNNAKLTDKQIKKGGYFWIMGDPGIGKSAIAAHLAKQKNYIAHFNIQSDGITSPKQMWSNLCKQLAIRYQFANINMPNDVYEIAQLANKYLAWVSENKLSNNERCVVIIDALDEANMTGFPIRTNTLLLPSHLPEKVYFILTSRKDNSIQISFNSLVKQLFIEHNSSENIADIELYLNKMVVTNGIKKYLKKNTLNSAAFIDAMIDKSEGNFMYLYYVLREFEYGRYQNLDISHLPRGLQGYYNEHWKLIQGQSKNDAWVNYKIPVLTTLTLAKQPLSLTDIKAYSNIKKLSSISSALHDWLPFLHEYRGLYSIYHSSFNDFLKAKSQIAAEAIDLETHRDQLIDNMKNYLKR